MMQVKVIETGEVKTLGLIDPDSGVDFVQDFVGNGSLSLGGSSTPRTRFIRKTLRSARRDGKTTMGNKITVTAAAALLGVTPQRVRALIKAGILQAEKFGRDWQIDGESVESRKKAMEQKKREP